MGAREKTYALYHGDDFICLGTIKEIAKYQNISPETIYFYSTKSYRERVGYDSYLLIKVEDDECTKAKKT